MNRKLLLLLSITLFAACNNPDAKAYLDFLYANMALPDSIDYPQSYYEDQVAIAQKARAEMPWGKDVPEREYRHFVLPPRVSNEDLDDFRTTYYDELAKRVGQLNIEDAILEVNHWCHEHVTYRPTSARTLGPASTIRTAYGRCGEESVLLVAALRTVGIPARQVYTPRWAHTDDNHAWVEAWANGRWHFLGACEPEPVLDLGWFNESASRGMLMHTKVFGNYDGPEDVVKRETCLTEINVTANYAPTRKMVVSVVDSENNPVEDANVEFKIYNYAEFYTVASAKTDSRGQSSLTAGLGDMLVWATKDGSMACQKINFKSDSLITLTLGKDTDVLYRLQDGQPIDIVPPSPSVAPPSVSEAQRQENNRRLAYEDSIRHAYEATMPDPRSRGNHGIIEMFIDSASAVGKKAEAQALVDVLPDKDLQDVSLEVLLDNIRHQASLGYDCTSTEVKRNLLSPRIENERLTAYKTVLHSTFRGMSANDIAQWVRDSITIVSNRNPQRLRISPLGVMHSRMSDQLGRNIFFVAACRAAGIAARINEINGKTQYFDNTNTWIDIAFETSDSQADGLPQAKKGTLKLAYIPTRYIPDAKYYTHFTISLINEDNRLNLLTYPEDATSLNTFSNGVELDAGTYVLTSGTRMADGSVLSSMQTFTIEPGQTTNLSFTLRNSDDKISVKGSLNAENLYIPMVQTGKQLSAINNSGSAEGISLLSTCGRGYYILGMVAPNHEPSNHVLRDLSIVSQELEAWGRKIVILFSDDEAASRFNLTEFNGLPSTLTWGTDINGSILQEVIEQMHLKSADLPIFLVCDSFNRVVFVQQGYTIGLGETLNTVVQKLNSQQ